MKSSKSRMKLRINTDCYDSNCNSRLQLLHQFPIAKSFSKYLHWAKRLFVSKEGWKTARISIQGTENCTDVYRSVVHILKSIVRTAIATALLRTDGVSHSQLSRTRVELFHRFLYLSLWDMVEGSRSGIFIDGSLVFLRLKTIISDWKQERDFLR